ncbi:unnamed protein product, partial [Rotaria sp. Silwood2]
MRLIAVCFTITLLCIVYILVTKHVKSNVPVFAVMPTTSIINVEAINNVKDTLQIKWSPRNPPILDFFVRTWRGDGHWLIFLLRSIDKYVPRTLYRDVVITFSSTETAYFQSYLPFFSLSIKLIPTNDVY